MTIKTTQYPCYRIFRPRWFVGNKIKEPMILCARNTSRSIKWTEHECRSHSENMWDVCLSYIQNNKISWSDTFCDKIHEVRKCFGALFSWLYFSDADWLGRQTPITWLTLDLNSDSLFISLLWYHIIITIKRKPKETSWSLNESTLNIKQTIFYYLLGKLYNLFVSFLGHLRDQRTFLEDNVCIPFHGK